MTDPTPAAGRARPERRRRLGWLRRWGRWFAVPVALLVLTGGYVGVTFVQVWDASRRDGARPAEAIVVLGAAQYDGRPSPVLQNRLDHALELHRSGLAPLIVVTGGRQEGDRFTEATTGYNYLRDQGVPDAAIRKEVQGHTTYESLSAVTRFLGEEGIDDVILVSSPGHAKRLAGIAGDLGLDAVVSSSSGSPAWRTLVRETLAVSAGRLVGYRRLEQLDS